MADRAKTVDVPRREASLYLAKARAFASEAGAALEHENADAALLLSVHAAISAADSVSVALAGKRSADQDHARTIELLESVARGSEELGQRARQLRALLEKKNTVAYESRRATAGEARDAVARAERLVEWAGSTVARARL